MPISERNAPALLIVLPIVMTACSSSPDPFGHQPTVPCGRALAQRCSLERSVTPHGTILTLRAADGGFRRLRVPPGGGGLAAADGAEPAIVRGATAGSIDVQVGTDRYRLPAGLAQLAAASPSARRSRPRPRCAPPNRRCSTAACRSTS